MTELELFDWAESLSKEQIAFLCDGGWYEVAIKGYLIAAAQLSNFDEKQIINLMNGFREAINTIKMQEAEQLYNMRGNTAPEIFMDEEVFL